MSNPREQSPAIVSSVERFVISGAEVVFGGYALERLSAGDKTGAIIFGLIDGGGVLTDIIVAGVRRHKFNKMIESKDEEIATLRRGKPPQHPTP